MNTTRVYYVSRLYHMYLYCVCIDVSHVPVSTVLAYHVYLCVPVPVFILHGTCGHCM